MTSIDALTTKPEDGNNHTFAPRTIQLEICDKDAPPYPPTSKPRKNSIAPIDIPDAEIPRIPRYLRDPSRRNSIQPRKTSLQIDKDSPAIVNSNYGCIAQVDESSASNTGLEPFKPDGVVSGTTENEDTESQQSQKVKRKVNFRNNPSLKSDPHYRRNSLPAPPPIDNLSYSERLRTRRASHAVGSYKGNRPPGSGLNRLNNDDHELEIIISPASRSIDKDSENDIRSSVVKFELVPEETSTRRTEPTVDTVFTNIGAGVEALPGMANADRLEFNADSETGSQSADAAKRTRRPTRTTVGPFIPKPDNHILLSVFSCICCCPLLGIVAVIFAYQVDSKYEDGEKEKSLDISQKAKCWALSAVMLGMMVITGALMYVVIIHAIPK